jgi:hypothetical protein
MLNKQSCTANKRYTSSLGLGIGLTTGQTKNVHCYETFKQAPELDRFFGTIQVKNLRTRT